MEQPPKAVPAADGSKVAVLGDPAAVGLGDMPGAARHVKKAQCCPCIRKIVRCLSCVGLEADYSM